jgi:ABC-type uncharacterized transport system permease subunit
LAALIPKGTFMADSQRSMVSIVAIIAIVILVVIAIYFVRERSEPGLEIEIGSTDPAKIYVGQTLRIPPLA